MKVERRYDERHYRRPGHVVRSVAVSTRCWVHRDDSARVVCCARRARNCAVPGNIMWCLSAPRTGTRTGRWALKAREVSTMSDEQAAPETKGVTATLLSIIDLGPEIEGMAGRQLRMRMFTFEPGAVFGPLHDHKDRPGLVYILQGTITDHRSGVATDYGPGVGWPEDRNTRHWLENRGAVPAVEISVDIVPSSH